MSEESPGNEADLKTVGVTGVVIGCLRSSPIMVVVIGEVGVDCDLKVGEVIVQRTGGVGKAERVGVVSNLAPA